MTIGLLTPFYFIRAGYFVSIPPVLVPRLGVAAFFAVEMATKIVSLFRGAPIWVAAQGRHVSTLLMASGLTFGTISARLSAC